MLEEGEDPETFTFGVEKSPVKGKSTDANANEDPERVTDSGEELQELALKEDTDQEMTASQADDPVEEAATGTTEVVKKYNKQSEATN